MNTEYKSYARESEVPIKQLILNVRTWFRFLFDRWYILLIAGLVGGVFGFWYTFKKSPIYTATTTFVLESGDGKGGLSRYAGVAAMAGIDLGISGGGLFQGDNIIELYKSRTMLVKALLSEMHSDSSELLIERYISYNGIRENWEGRPDLLALDFSRSSTTLDPGTLRLRDSVMTSFVNAIRNRILSVGKPDKNLSIIKVDVTSPDEIFSKELNDRLVKEVNDFYIQTRTKKSVDNINILQQKVDSVRAVMTGAIYSAAKISDDTPNLNPTRQVQRLAPSQEAQFSAETNKIMLAQLLQNLELTKLNQLQEQPLLQLIDQPVYPLKVERLGELKGAIIGSFLLGFLTLILLIAFKWYRDIMYEEM